MSNSLHFMTIAEASKLIANKELSPVTLTESFLERIEALDGSLKSYVTLLKDEAINEALVAEKDINNGGYKGPMHGIPIGVKDLYDTKGIRTTGQSKVLENRVPLEDSTVVAKLKSAGAITLGKLSMWEFALGGPDTSIFEISRNPWNLDRQPGGSSSGSGTAVAAGLCMGALGSDTGGSIRIPAAFCGIVGLKPTYGRVSRRGVLPLAWSLDHCGPMTWTVEDTALMLQAFAGHDHLDKTSVNIDVPDYTLNLAKSLKGLKVGIPRHYINSPLVGTDSDVIDSFDSGLALLADLGAEIVEIEIPSLAYATTANTLIMIAEAFSYHRENLISQPENYGDSVRGSFILGGTYTSGDYQRALRARSIIRDEFKAILKEVDVIATPSQSAPAGPFNFDLLALLMTPNYWAPYNETGMPAISVPSGFSSDGMPIGIQFAGRPFEETTVLNVGHVFQTSRGLLDNRPIL